MMRRVVRPEDCDGWIVTDCDGCPGLMGCPLVYIGSRQGPEEGPPADIGALLRLLEDER